MGEVRDIDGDGVLTRNDALLAKARCSLRLCNIPVIPISTGTTPIVSFDVASVS